MCVVVVVAIARWIGIWVRMVVLVSERARWSWIAVSIWAGLAVIGWIIVVLIIV